MHDSDPHGRQPDHDAGGVPPHPCGAAPAGTARQASGKPDAASMLPSTMPTPSRPVGAHVEISTGPVGHAARRRRRAPAAPDVPHVGAALLPQRRALPPARDLHDNHPPRGAAGQDVEPGTIRANAEIVDRADGGPSYPCAASGGGRPTGTTSSSSRAVPAVARRRVGAREVLRLFELPEVRNLGVPPTWLPVRVAFTARDSRTRRKPG